MVMPMDSGPEAVRAAILNAPVVAGPDPEDREGDAIAAAGESGAEGGEEVAAVAGDAPADGADAAAAGGPAGEGEAEAAGDGAPSAEDADSSEGDGDDAAEPDVPAPPPMPQPWGYDTGEMNAEWALVLMGSKAVIVRENPEAPVEDRLRILSLDAFRAFFLNRPTQVMGARGFKVISWAERWLGARRRRTFSGIEFVPDPGEPPGTPGYLNLWRGFSVKPREKVNGYAVFRDHLFTNICGQDEELFRWLCGWFAHIVQRPRERVGTCVVMRGRMGSGKTKVGEVIGSLIESHYFLVDDPRYVTGQFNAHMASCLLLQAEEAVWAGDKVAEGRLKSLITSKSQMIEAKGVDPIRLVNNVRLIMTSNEGWVVPAGMDERRYACFDVADTCIGNFDYFAEMDEELDNGGREALLHDLLSFDLSTVNLRLIPKTKALLEQKIRSLDHVESWWLGRLMEGETTRGASSWCRLISKARLADDYLQSADRIGIKRRAADIEMGLAMRKLVPGIGERRTVDEGTGDSRRVWCWELPTLDDCRVAFTAAIGQTIAWPVDSGGETGREGETALF